MRRRMLWGVGAGLFALALRRRARQRFALLGKGVVITGGSRGLGLALAREFARRGARIAICSEDMAELERARAELAERAFVFAKSCDVTNVEQLQGFLADARAALGQIDVLVNNAGIIQVGPIESMDIADYEQAMRVHFWAPLHASLGVLHEMKKRGSGRIVNISSIGGLVAVPHLVPYDASKFALTGLSDGFRAELRRYGIRVLTVCPGLMRTGSAPNATFKGHHRAEYAWFSLAASNPLAAMSAPRAAIQIVDACVRGDARLILSARARVLALLNAVFPNLLAGWFGLAARFMPGPGGIGVEKRLGKESESFVTRSPLEWFGRRAAEAHNQV